MFHSAALKLTLWYLTIVMVLSVSLSVVIYHFASNELARNTQRQIYFFNDQLDPSDFTNFAHLRQKQLDQGRNRLKGDFILFNLLVLVGGGAISYALARRTLEPIEQSLEAQKRFTADASHELRTPLTVMQSEIEVALRNSGLTKAQSKELLVSNLEEVAKLKALAEGLLRLASTDKLNLNHKISLKVVAQQAIERWSKIAKTKKIKMHSEIEEVFARGDQQSLIDLISIILDNAIKYSREGNQITVRVFKKERSACISVEDEGRGIKNVDLPRIFERFYRSDDGSRSKQQADGYGLGLAIAKKIVELHSGSIEVKSAPDKGSLFTIYLPKT